MYVYVHNDTTDMKLCTYVCTYMYVHAYPLIHTYIRTYVVNTKVSSTCGLSIYAVCMYILLTIFGWDNYPIIHTYQLSRTVLHHKYSTACYIDVVLTLTMCRCNQN